MRAEYFIILGLILVFPLVLSFDLKLGFYRQKGPLLLAIFGVSIPFWLWDILATARGHWWFNEEYTLGARLLGMPVEEWLFFPVLVFVSVFTWESVKYLWRRRRQK